MDPLFTVHLEQLKNGRSLSIDEEVSPEFLGVNERELQFPSKVSIQGEISLVEGNLILNLHLATVARLPCIICNEPVDLPMELPHLCHAVPMEEISGSLFNYSEVIREHILLEAPRFAECGGACPQRALLSRYFPKSNAKKKEVNGYHPFQDLS